MHYFVTSILAVCFISAVATFLVVSGAATPSCITPSKDEAAQALRYWTPERMALAKPMPLQGNDENHAPGQPIPMPLLGDVEHAL